MNVYLVVLSGQGDVTVNVIDKETWDWLNGPSGQPANGPSAWDDPFVPVSQRGPDPIQLTRGSWENDRALQLKSCGSYGQYWSVREALAAIRKAGDTVVDEYQGCIY